MHKQFITCVNGNFLPAEAAALPVADRGTRFGDGVFETMRLKQGIPYQFEQHLQRLAAGLAALRIAPPAVDWQAHARTLIARNAATTGFLRLSVTRGVGSRGYMPLDTARANWVMEYLPETPLPPAPWRLWQSTITRPPLSALPGNHKLAHGIGSTLALLDAQDHACDEALMLTAEGHLSEAASANLFWVHADTLYTPALSTGCLAGTTRAAVMRLSPIRVAEVTASISALAVAETVFITNARLGVWPVISIAPNAWQFGAAHPIIGALQARLEVDRTAYVASTQAAWITP